MPLSPDQLPDDPQALKQIIAAMAQDAIAAQAEIAKLRFQLARYRRAEFGRSSEKLAHEAEQLELAIEALEADQAELLATASPSVATAIESAVEAQKPARRPLPEQLPREDVLHAAPCTCPTCGGALRRIGEDITETLDYVPGRFKVIRHIREKLSRRSCDNIVAAPAPDHAIARGRAGAGLRSSPAKASTWKPQPCPAGSVRLVRRWLRSSMHSLPTSWRPTPCTSTTRRCRCWPRARARPRPAGYGPTSATSGHSPVRAHPLRCSSTRRIEKGSILRLT